jgi:hypothetical protein
MIGASILLDFIKWPIMKMLDIEMGNGKNCIPIETTTPRDSTIQ